MSSDVGFGQEDRLRSQIYNVKRLRKNGRESGYVPKPPPSPYADQKLKTIDSKQ